MKDLGIRHVHLKDQISRFVRSSDGAVFTGFCMSGGNFTDQLDAAIVMLATPGVYSRISASYWLSSYLISQFPV